MVVPVTIVHKMRVPPEEFIHLNCGPGYTQR